MIESVKKDLRENAPIYVLAIFLIAIDFSVIRFFELNTLISSILVVLTTIIFIVASISFSIKKTFFGPSNDVGLQRADLSSPDKEE